MSFDPDALPKRWAVWAFGSELLLDGAGWRRKGEPPRISVPLAPGARLPFLVEIEWEAAEGTERLAWPLNVVDPGALPPPEELRNLPLNVLIDALSSTRPIHAALAASLRRRHLPARPGTPRRPNDPLDRYAGTGRFLQRARHFALALEGLVPRMERPAASEESLEWRLTGPVSPLALAKAVVKDLEQDSMPGESDFMLAEMALTLGRVNWQQTGEIIGVEVARKQARGLIGELREMSLGTGRIKSQEASRASNKGIDRYVKRAFREVNV
jgi:hypothetical protein